MLLPQSHQEESAPSTPLHKAQSLLVTHLAHPHQEETTPCSTELAKAQGPPFSDVIQEAFLSRPKEEGAGSEWLDQ